VPTRPSEIGLDVKKPLKKPAAQLRQSAPVKMGVQQTEKTVDKIDAED